MNDSICEYTNISDQTDWRRLLTPAERTMMLRDIVCVSLAVGARLFPDQPWSDFEVAAGSIAGYKSPIEQLGFIESLLPRLARSLAQIVQAPLSAPVSRPQSTLPERARRVTAAAWMSHARQIQSWPMVQETVTSLSHDVPENRAVKSFLEVLKRDSQAIRRIAEAEDEREATDRATRCTWWLTQLLAEPLWDEVAAKSSDWVLPPTQRESLRPEYADIFRERVRTRKAFCFDWSHPLLTLPPRETWRIYEFWCFLIVLQALHELGWNASHSQEFFFARQGRLTVMPATGEQSRIHLRSRLGRELTLAYNPVFAEGRESLSHRMQPDIALSDGSRLWILDAKFKLYAEPGEEGDDINQMHAYRDAIIDTQGTRNVAAAWCLYTGQAQTPNRAYLTYGRRTDTAVGALCLRPGNAESLTNLRELLHRWTQPGVPTAAPPLFPGT